MDRKLLVFAVICILLGTTVIPVVRSEVTNKKVPIRLSTSDGESTEKQLSVEDAEELISLLNISEENSEEYKVYLPVILSELEYIGLIENAEELEQTILGNIKNNQFNMQNNLFMNIFCFIIGNSTNSAVLTPLTLSMLFFTKIILSILWFCPFLSDIIFSIFEIVYYSLTYPPKLYFPFGVWMIGWDGKISSFGLLGHRETLIDGGKWGKNYLVFGFKGLWLTLPSERGYEYTKNWFIGSAVAVLGR